MPPIVVPFQRESCFLNPLPRLHPRPVLAIGPSATIFSEDNHLMSLADGTVSTRSPDCHPGFCNMSPRRMQRRFDNAPRAHQEKGSCTFDLHVHSDACHAIALVRRNRRSSAAELFDVDGIVIG